MAMYNQHLKLASRFLKFFRVSYLFSLLNELKHVPVRQINASPFSTHPRFHLTKERGNAFDFTETAKSKKKNKFRPIGVFTSLRPLRFAFCSSPPHAIIWPVCIGEVPCARHDQPRLHPPSHPALLPTVEA